MPAGSWEILTFCLLAPPLEVLLADEEDIRGWEPGPGESTRAGTLGGLGSAAGERRCTDRWEVEGACIVVVIPSQDDFPGLLTKNHVVAGELSARSSRGRGMWWLRAYDDQGGWRSGTCACVVGDVSGEKNVEGFKRFHIAGAELPSYRDNTSSC